MIEVREITPHVRMKNNTFFIFNKLIAIFTNSIHCNCKSRLYLLYGVKNCTKVASASSNDKTNR